VTVEAAIRIDPYDRRWPDMFLAERELLAEVLAPWLAGPIEHVGSTAVPDLPAKPVIDIMAAVESLDASRPALERLAAIGYCYAPYREDVMHWLCKPSPEFRTHHLHLVPYRSPPWEERIAFRDRLRTDPELRNQYTELKHTLAERYRNDREAYTQSKAPFIEQALLKEPKQ
jgi:GrpB-like predicted nucleotidyltransferase (UPF0157 family)